MDDIEPTERARILREVRDKIRLPRFGIVTKIWNYTSADDNSNHEVNVLVEKVGGGGQNEHRRVPVAAPVADMIAPPRVDDMVLVQFLEGDNERPVVTNVLYNDEDRALLGSEGVVRRRRGSIYTEMHPDGDWSRTAVKPGDDDTPTTKVEVKDDGGATKVNVDTDGDVIVDADGSVDLQASGDITVSAGGDVVIDEGGAAEKVATENHTHDYSGNTSDGASYSGTTTGPSEVTECEIE